MDIGIIQYVIVCPLIFVASMIDAIAGGGGLVSLTGYLIAGLPPHSAIATNKFTAIFGSTTSTIRYAKDGFIPWKKALFCIIFALVGSICGAELALIINEKVFKVAMLFVLPVTAFYVFRSKALICEKEELPLVKTVIISCAIALLIGVYDGVYGPGAGTFLILLLTAVAHMSLDNAQGTAKLINLGTNAAALAVFIINGKVVYSLGIAAAAFSVAGSFVGTKCYERGGSKIVKPVMIAVLAIFFIKVIVELLLN